MAVGVRLIPLVVGWLEQNARVFCPSLDRPIHAPVTIWLLELAGRRVLIDAGASTVEEAAAHGHPHYRRAPSEAPAERLRALGVDLESIDTVVLTHLHWDHAYNADLCPRARAIVQGSEVRFAGAPPEPSWPYYEHRPDGDGYLQRWHFSPVEGHHRLLNGVELVPLPGHTPGSQGVLVSHPAAGRWLVSGDTVPLRENIERGEANGIRHEPVEAERSLERIRELDCVALPSHDPVLAAWDGRDVIGAWPGSGREA